MTDHEIVALWRQHKEVMGFAHALLAAEREACEKVAEQELLNTSMLTSMPPKSSAAWNILQGIRARGNK